MLSIIFISPRQLSEFLQLKLSVYQSGIIIINMKSTLRLYLASPILLVGLLIGGIGLAAAASANISHSYSGAKGITMGSLVSLDSEQDNFVEAANISTANKLVGITVAVEDSLVAIDSADNKVQVATSGVVNALVSDVNGPIKTGDQIAVSPFNGVGMKAEPGSRIVGLAQTSLGGDGAKSQPTKVTNKNGKIQTINVGFVRVSIAIGSVPRLSDETENNILQKVARSITGHYVSTARLVVSTVIAIIALLALVMLIYTSVYGTIVAVGRNPLAKSSIFRALISVMGLVVITAFVAIGTIYLIIR